MSKCKNRHGKNNPFIRIVVEKNEEEKAKQILEQLNSWAGGGGLQFDIEVATIEKFYERGKGDWKPF